MTSGRSLSVNQPVGVDQVPPIVAEIAAGAAITLVWRNELHGLAFRIERGDRAEFVKWAPDHPEIDLELEAAKLRWAGRYITVPPVLATGRDSETTAWLHTLAIAGVNAIAPQWKARPEQTTYQLGAGLRALHDQLPVADCPWRWDVADRATMITKPEHKVLAEQSPPADKLVVCHGDACSPNTLIGPDGRWSGHVDFGNLGVGDRWADIAVATYAVGWNYDPKYEDTLLEGYGIDRDQERIDYYRRLWDAT
jgi:kanamycin kinase